MCVCAALMCVCVLGDRINLIWSETLSDHTHTLISYTWAYTWAYPGDTANYMINSETT